MERETSGFSDAGLICLQPETALPVAVPDPLLSDHPALEDHQLITRLIRLAVPRHEHPEDFATVLLERFSSPGGIFTATDQALRSVEGVGPHLLSAIRVMHEAALRLHKAALSRHEVFSDRNRLYRYLSAVVAREVIEQFRILFLAPDDRLIADEPQARGTVNHTPVYPREVVRRALELGAGSIVLVHNHPSGDPSPSPDDIEMTRRVSAAAAVLGLTVRDHIIVGNGRWLSFAEQKLL